MSGQLAAAVNPLVKDYRTLGNAMTADVARLSNAATKIQECATDAVHRSQEHATALVNKLEVRISGQAKIIRVLLGVFLLVGVLAGMEWEVRETAHSLNELAVSNQKLLQASSKGVDLNRAKRLSKQGVARSMDRKR